MSLPESEDQSGQFAYAKWQFATRGWMLLLGEHSAILVTGVADMRTVEAMPSPPT